MGKKKKLKDIEFLINDDGFFVQHKHKNLCYIDNHLFLRHLLDMTSKEDFLKLYKVVLMNKLYKTLKAEADMAMVDIEKLEDIKC